MAIGRSILQMLVVIAAAAGTGCATGPALYDLVVPSPVGELSVEPEGPGTAVRWRAKYGREPEDFAHYPIHVWLERDGPVEVPVGFESCTPVLARLASDGSLGAVELVQFRTLLARASMEPRYGPPPAGEHAGQFGGCVVVLAPRVGDRRRIVTYDLAGREIHEQTLPLDVPIIDPRRWGIVALATAMDALCFPVWGAIGVVGVVYIGGEAAVHGIGTLVSGADDGSTAP